MSKGMRDFISSLRIPGTVAGWHLLIIILSGAACYSNSFSVPFIFDDIETIVNKHDVFSSTSLVDILLHSGARRITDVTFALNYKLHGLQVAGYHLTNLVIHLSAAVVLYFLCTTLLRALSISWPADDPVTGPSALHSGYYFIPLAVSLLFVCHPIQTQAVTYIVQRYTSLAAFFYLLTLLAYVKGRTVIEVRGYDRVVAWWGFCLVTAALLGYYTKQSTLSFPLMIIMLEICLFNGRKLKHLIILSGAIIALAVATTLVPALLNGTLAEFMHDLDHKTSEDLYTTRTSYFLTQLRVIVTYLRLLIMPLRQRLDYDYPEYTSLLNLEISASLLLHTVLAGLAVFLYVRSSRQLRSPNGYLQRLITIGIAWFYIALSVTSSIIPITDVIMEHRVYLPSAGIFIAFAAVLHLLARKLKNGLRYQWLGLAVLCLFLSVTTLKRNHVWRDELRFWQHEARLSPQSGRVLANLGLEYLDRENYEQALRLFVAVVKLEPNLDGVWTMFDNALQGLGRYQGRFKMNDEYLTAEGEIDYRHYNRFYSNEFNNMGLAVEHFGQPEEAFTWYKKSLALTPDFDLALFNLGLVSAHLGIAGNAELAVAKLTKINPQLAAALQKNIRADFNAK